MDEKTKKQVETLLEQGKGVREVSDRTGADIIEVIDIQEVSISEDLLLDEEGPDTHQSILPLPKESLETEPTRSENNTRWDFFEKPKKKPKKKSSERITINVICPHCSMRQTYTYRKTTKRKHKYCTECDKHFDINLIKQKKLKFNRKEKKDKIPEDFEEKFKTINLKLNTSDKAILRLFLKHHRPLTQGFIADHTAVSRSTASRRLRDPLIKLGIVREIPTYNFATSSLKHYELVKNLAINAKIQDRKQNTEDKDEREGTDKFGSANFVERHNNRIRYNILSDHRKSDVWKEANRRQLMGANKSWEKRFYTLRDPDMPHNLVELQVSHKSVVCTLMGSGTNSEEATANLNKKAENVKRILNKYHNIIVSDPELVASSEDIHWVAKRDTREIRKQRMNVWTDKSHTGSVESRDRAFIDQIVCLEDNVSRIEEKIDALKLPKPEIEIKHLEENISKRMESSKESIKSDLKSLFTQEMASFKTHMKREFLPTLVDAFSETIKEIVSDRNNDRRDPPGGDYKPPVGSYVL